MEKELKKAPNILTPKDLDYLKDIFGWNYAYYKECEDALLNIEDKEVSEIFSNSSKMFNNNLTTILNILKEGEKNE